MNDAGIVNIKINGNDYSVPAGITILNAAKLAGINIPTLCFLEKYSPHTSCYLCLVKIAGISRYMPACATIVVNGGDYVTEDDGVTEMRRSALELLLSEHRGDCLAPCRIACPAHMNIPEMMCLINAGKWDEAVKVVKEDIAMPAIFSRICPAYCEKACKRKQFDSSLAICELQKLTAERKYSPIILNKSEKIAIIGGGVSGLSAAYYLRTVGFQVDLYEKNAKLLSKIKSKYSNEILPLEIIENEITDILNTGINIIFSEAIITDEFIAKYDAVLLAVGLNNNLQIEKDKKEQIIVEHYLTKTKGLFACGSAIIGDHDPVRSMASGRFAAAAIEKFLGGNKLKEISLFSTRLGQLTADEKDKFLALWQNITGRYSPEKHSSLDFAHAELEAGRCLQCSCLKVVTCELRKQSISCGASTHRYDHDHKKAYNVDYSHPEIIFEPAKCIKCGICITISKEDTGAGISFVNRGYGVEPAVPFDGKLDSALNETALKCADNCPTGAISRRNYVAESR